MKKTTKKSAVKKSVETSKKTTKKAAPKKVAKTTKKTTKKVSPKKGVKTTKKAAPKKAAKVTTPKRADGLSKTEVAILKALAKTKDGVKEMCKPEIMKTTGFAKITAKVMGAGSREDAGVQGGGLMDKGLVGCNVYEGERLLHYYITAKGRQAIK